MAETAERPKGRPFWRRSEFWVTLATQAAPFLVDALPPTVKFVIATVAGGIYTVSRGIAKHGTGR